MTHSLKRDAAFGTNNFHQRGQWIWRMLTLRGMLTRPKSRTWADPKYSGRGTEVSPDVTLPRKGLLRGVTSEKLRTGLADYEVTKCRMRKVDFTPLVRKLTKVCPHVEISNRIRSNLANFDHRNAALAERSQNMRAAKVVNRKSRNGAILMTRYQMGAVSTSLFR